ncbi:MAG: methylmalonyl-CoA mutase small subunit, partial [Paramuribaculum sp.]|nr:methylmalonyl-CoA mutase small subunit [Paramuribaculum sp.]
MAEKKEKLFDQFPPVSTAEWKAKVEADLKGAPFDKKLVWRTNEGFDVQPMYRAEDIEGLATTESLPGEYPYVRGTKTDNDWLTRQEIQAEDANAANAKAKEILTKGVTSLGFTGCGTDYATVNTLLDGIDIETVEVNFSCCPRHAEELAQSLVKYIKEKKAESSFTGSIDFNPFRKPLKHGKPFPGDIASIAKTLLETTASVPGLKVLAVDSVMLS